MQVALAAPEALALPQRSMAFRRLHPFSHGVLTTLYTGLGME